MNRFGRSAPKKTAGPGTEKAHSLEICDSSASRRFNYQIRAHSQPEADARRRPALRSIGHYSDNSIPWESMSLMTEANEHAIIPMQPGPMGLGRGRWIKTAHRVVHEPFEPSLVSVVFGIAPIETARIHLHTSRAARSRPVSTSGAFCRKGRVGQDRADSVECHGWYALLGFR